MFCRLSIGIGVCLMMGGFSVLSAQDQPQASQSLDGYEPSQPTPKLTLVQQQYELIQPRLGRGYVPYSYPAIDSCPCASDGCFHPHRYYCGGKQYRKNWRRRWLRAHLGLGSMLDGYPCECILPTVGRPYFRTVTTGATSEPELPPRPEPATESPY